MYLDFGAPHISPISSVSSIWSADSRHGILPDAATRIRLGVVKAAAVHHVSINVADVDRALSFYTDVLGLTQRSDRPDFGFGGAWLDAGDQQVHLIEAPVPPNLGQHFAVLVDDLGEVVAELRAQGLTVSDPTPVGRSHQAFVNDPDGNVVELHQTA
jgi:catechol 2,3-dioxygenase-like lactoylglutathione lyase family enzyme